MLVLTRHFHASFFESCSSEDLVRELVTWYYYFLVTDQIGFGFCLSSISCKLSFASGLFSNGMGSYTGSTIISPAKSFRILGLLTSHNSDMIPSKLALKVDDSLNGLNEVPRARICVKVEYFSDTEKTTFKLLTVKYRLLFWDVSSENARLQNKTYTDIVHRLRPGLDRERNIFILRLNCRPAPYRWINSQALSNPP